MQKKRKTNGSKTELAHFLRKPLENREYVGRGGSLRWVPLKTPAENADTGHVLREGDRITRWLFSCPHLKGRLCETPHIRFGRDAAALCVDKATINRRHVPIVAVTAIRRHVNKEGCRVPGRADVWVLTQRGTAKLLGVVLADPKVSEKAPVFLFGVEHVGRLQISYDDPLLVTKLEATANMNNVLLELVGIEALSSNGGEVSCA